MFEFPNKKKVISEREGEMVPLEYALRYKQRHLH